MEQVNGIYIKFCKKNVLVPGRDTCVRKRKTEDKLESQAGNKL